MAKQRPIVSMIVAMTCWVSATSCSFKEDHYVPPLTVATPPNPEMLLHNGVSLCISYTEAGGYEGGNHRQLLVLDTTLNDYGRGTLGEFGTVELRKPRAHASTKYPFRLKVFVIDEQKAKRIESLAEQWDILQCKSMEDFSMTDARLWELKLWIARRSHRTLICSYPPEGYEEYAIQGPRVIVAEDTEHRAVAKRFFNFVDGLFEVLEDVEPVACEEVDGQSH